MASNLTIEDDLISEARKVGHHKIQKEAVTTALMEYIAREKQAEIIDIFGTIHFDQDYDYKKARNR